MCHYYGVLMTDRAIDKDAIVYRDVFQQHPEWFKGQVDLFY
jgi:nitrous oxide reductase accessory protein NosL